MHLSNHFALVSFSTTEQKRFDLFTELCDDIGNVRLAIAALC